MSGFTAQQIAPSEVATVYPLLRAVIPGLQLKEWISYGRRIANPKRADAAGIVAVARTGRPLPCGLFIYRSAPDPVHRRVLWAEHLVAIDVLDPLPALRALAQELEALAARLGCTAIRTSVPGACAPLAAGLLDAGHQPTGSTLVKALA